MRVDDDSHMDCKSDYKRKINMHVNVKKKQMIIFPWMHDIRKAAL